MSNPLIWPFQPVKPLTPEQQRRATGAMPSAKKSKANAKARKYKKRLDRPEGKR